FLAVPEVHPPRSFDRMLTPIRHHEVSAPHELRTHCMPHRGVPVRFRKQTKSDKVLTYITEEACRCLLRAACEQSVRTERIEFCSVDRENILEDQPSTIQTVQIFEHFTVFVRYREIPELATALVQVDFPSRSPLVPDPKTSVQARQCITEYQVICDPDRDVNSVHRYLEIHLVLVQCLRNIHTEIIQPVLARP